MEKVTITAIGTGKPEISIEIVSIKDEIDALIEKLREITGDDRSTRFRIEISVDDIMKILDGTKEKELLSLVGIPEGLHSFHTRCLSYFGSTKKKQGQEALIALYNLYNISSPESLRDMILNEESYNLYDEIPGFSHTSMTWVILALMQEAAYGNTDKKFQNDISSYFPGLGYDDANVQANISHIIHMGGSSKKNNDILRVLLGKGIKIDREQLVIN